MSGDSHNYHVRLGITEDAYEISRAEVSQHTEQQMTQAGQSGREDCRSPAKMNPGEQHKVNPACKTSISADTGITEGRFSCDDSAREENDSQAMNDVDYSTPLDSPHSTMCDASGNDSNAYRVQLLHLLWETRDDKDLIRQIRNKMYHFLLHLWQADFTAKEFKDQDAESPHHSFGGAQPGSRLRPLPLPGSPSGLDRQEQLGARATGLEPWRFTRPTAASTSRSRSKYETGLKGSSQSDRSSPSYRKSPADASSLARKIQWSGADISALPAAIERLGSTSGGSRSGSASQNEIPGRQIEGYIHDHQQEQCTLRINAGGKMRKKPIGFSAEEAENEHLDAEKKPSITWAKKTFPRDQIEEERSKREEEQEDNKDIKESLGLYISCVDRLRINLLKVEEMAEDGSIDREAFHAILFQSNHGEPSKILDLRATVWQLLVQCLDMLRETNAAAEADCTATERRKQKLQAVEKELANMRTLSEGDQLKWIPLYEVECRKNERLKTKYNKLRKEATKMYDGWHEMKRDNRRLKAELTACRDDNMRLAAQMQEATEKVRGWKEECDDWEERCEQLYNAADQKVAEKKEMWHYIKEYHKWILENDPVDGLMRRVNELEITLLELSGSLETDCVNEAVMHAHIARLSSNDVKSVGNPSPEELS